MNIVVCGLCLRGNLGGPAMALTFKNEIIRLIPDATIIFAVPPIKEELNKANQYNIDICIRHRTRVFYQFKIFTPFIKTCRSLISYYYRYIKELRLARLEPHFLTWKQAFSKADIVINMSGIAYVGDGMLPTESSHRDFEIFKISKNRNIKYARFIQSFGPFMKKSIAKYAYEELNSIHKIYARGLSTKRECINLLNNSAKVEDYPDCAILLGTYPTFSKHLFLKYKLKPYEYTILSPSAVIRNTKTKGECLGLGHVKYFGELATNLIEKGHTIILFPHSKTPENKAECDYRVCEEIKKYCTAKNKRISIISDIDDPRTAKHFISKARLAIVSRYHASVAALSTMTPVLAIGWNHKYRDIFSYYNQEERVLDSRFIKRSEAIEKSLEFALADIKKINENQKKICKINKIKVKKAFKELSKWMKDQSK